MPSISERKKLSRLSKRDYIALTLGDTHFSDVKPVCRKEKNWFQVMKSHLLEVNEIQEFLQIPVICTGDLFDNPFPSCELLSWFITNVSSQWRSIYGNHDMPFHDQSEFDKSGYSVLSYSGIIMNMIYHSVIETRNGFLDAFPFPFGEKVIPHKDVKGRSHKTFGKSIAVIHDYIWKGVFSFKNAPNRKHIRNWRKVLKGYDFAVFGDNHQGFLSSIRKDGKRKTLLNGGTLMRRTVAENEYRPFVGLLRYDGNFEKYYLESPDNDDLHTTTKAKKLEKEEGKENKYIVQFARDLKATKFKGLDFEETIKKMASSLGSKVRQLLVHIINEAANEQNRKNGE